jgi:hypothetical protein
MQRGSGQRKCDALARDRMHMAQSLRND